MIPLRLFGPLRHRHPLALALTASIALHGAALAATHYLWRGTAPAPVSVRTVAMVMIERAAPTPDAHDAPATKPAGNRGVGPDFRVSRQPRSAPARRERRLRARSAPRLAAPREREPAATRRRRLERARCMELLASARTVECMMGC